jgi:hypothetical protein
LSNRGNQRGSIDGAADTCIERGAFVAVGRDSSVHNGHGSRLGCILGVVSAEDTKSARTSVGVWRESPRFAGAFATLSIDGGTLCSTVRLVIRIDRVPNTVL